MAILTQFSQGTAQLAGTTGNGDVVYQTYEFDLSRLRGSAFATTDSVNLFALPVNTHVIFASVRNQTALTGTVTRMDLGDDGDEDRYSSNFTAVTAGATSTIVPANVPFKHTTARHLRLKVAFGGSLADIGGIVEVTTCYVIPKINPLAKTSVQK